MAVGDHDPPEVRICATVTLEWPEGRVVVLDPSCPDGKAKVLEDELLPLWAGDEEDMITGSTEVHSPMDRVLADAVVVSWNDHDRTPQAGKLLSRLIDGIGADSCMVEEIASDDDEVDLLTDRGLHDVMETASGRCMAVDVNVRGMDEADQGQ